MVGINGSMASNETLISAICKTVAEILNVPESKISSVKLTSKRSMSLSEMVAFLSYDLIVTSTRTPESYKQALINSVATGGFIRLLHAKSGFQLENTYDLHFNDYSPTYQPTRSPLSEVSLQASKEFVVVSILNHIIATHRIVIIKWYIYDCKAQ